MTDVADPPAPDESWTNPLTAELQRRKDELMAMPGFELKMDLHGLERAGRVIWRNAEELTTFAEKFLRGGRHVREMPDDYEHELVRMLHNYLTSVSSLIESQRVVMRHRWPSARTEGEACTECKRKPQPSDRHSEFETKVYAEKRKEIFEGGEAEFMKDLRNYCTHRSIPLPALGTTFSMQAGERPVFVNGLTLNREELLEWDGWTGPAKKYLREKPEHIEMMPIITSYMSGVRRFFAWFVEEINSRCATIRDEYLTAAESLVAWYRKETGITDEFMGAPPPGAPRTGNRAQRRGQRQQPKRKRPKSKR